MKIIKYEHACLCIEVEGRVLIVDPGEFTRSLDIPSNVDGIVITHEHADHFDPHILAEIYNKNPNSVLVSLSSITEKMPDHMSLAVKTGDTITIGAFTLEFFGGAHAEIHASIPLIDNIGVMINNTVYYPGDSFVAPEKPVALLALPASGPWFKTSLAIDCMLSVQPTTVFSTHNIHNSEPGQQLFNRIVGGFAEKAGIEYIALTIGQSIER